MLLPDHFVQFACQLFADFVGAECHAKCIVCDFKDVFKIILNFIVNVVHAEVEVLKLGVLYSHPDLLSFSLLVLLGDLLNIVKLRNWFFWLFACLQFFVLFNNSITLFQLCKMRFNLVGREREFSYQTDQRSHMLVFKI